MGYNKKKVGDIPVFVFIDWSMRDDSPLSVFSQNLTPQEQNALALIQNILALRLSTFDEMVLRKRLYHFAMMCIS